MEAHRQSSNNIELLKLYWDEWKSRQEGLWKRIIQFFVVNFFVSTLPITIRGFQIPLPQLPLLTFPIVGILLTVFFLWFCLSESIRINSIDDKIKKIILDNFPQEYAKVSLVPMTKRENGVLKIFRWRMAIWIPISMSVMQLAIVAVMIYIIVIEKVS